MNTINISGNNRFKVLQDFNNNLFDKKYIKLKKNGNITITVFNKNEFRYLEDYKRLSIYDKSNNYHFRKNYNYIIYHLIYKYYKPYINIIYDMTDFIPYYILYPNIQEPESNKYPNKYYLFDECENIVKVFNTKIEKYKTVDVNQSTPLIAKCDDKYNTDITSYNTNENELPLDYDIVFNLHEFNQIFEKNESKYQLKNILLNRNIKEANPNKYENIICLKDISTIMYDNTKNSKMHSSNDYTDENDDIDILQT
jgi:hypothetical protein